jgi:hypothetical protein
MKFKYIVTILLIVVPQLVLASNFATIKLPRGVELEIPKGWVTLSGEVNKLIETSIEAVLDISDLELAHGQEVALIRANSRPKGTYAAVGVTSTTPVEGSPSEITNLNRSELIQLQQQIESNLRKVLPAQGNRLLDYYGLSEDQISGYPTLVSQYKRSGPKGPVQVAVVQIFTESQDITVNLSFRESEQAIWKAIIGKIYKSISVSAWP